MSSKNEKALGVIGGIGFLDLLFLLFLGLKISKVIDWSWWWVTAPLWGQLALTIVGVIVIILVWLVIKIFEKFQRKMSS